jgi:hypothetical protein
MGFPILLLSGSVKEKGGGCFVSKGRKLQRAELTQLCRRCCGFTFPYLTPLCRRLFQ